MRFFVCFIAALFYASTTFAGLEKDPKKNNRFVHRHDELSGGAIGVTLSQFTPPEMLEWAVVAASRLNMDSLSLLSVYITDGGSLEVVGMDNPNASVTESMDIDIEHIDVIRFTGSPEYSGQIGVTAHI